MTAKPRHRPEYIGDIRHRRWLLAKLRQIRLDLGVTLANIGDELHVTPDAVSHWEQRATVTPYILSVQQYARAIDHAAVLQIIGLDVPVLPLDPHRPAKQADAAHRDAVFNQLLDIRKTLGLTQRVLGARMGITSSSVYHFEEGEHEPRLSSYQRYARALGGRLVVRVRRAPVVDEVAIRRTLDGKLAFSALNEIDKVTLFRDHAPKCGVNDLTQKLRISGDTFRDWQARALAVAA